MQLQKKFFNKHNYNFTKNKPNPFYLERNELLKTQTSFLCTISGGQDSILTFFKLLHATNTTSLEVLYCHHFWQIKNFFSARLIYQVSYLGNVSYRLILPHNLMSTENHAREWRQKSFYRVSQLEQVTTVLTGHTETDIIEKNLTNLFRGTSPAGLSQLSFFRVKFKVGLFFMNSKTVSQNFLFKKLKKETKRKLFFKTVPSSPASSSSKTLSFFPKQCFETRATKFFKVELKKIVKQRIKPLSMIFRFVELGNLQVKKQATSPFSGFKNQISSSFCYFSQNYARQIKLTKPLKKTPRVAVSKSLLFYDLPLLNDLTNFSFTFSRNKIRHQFLPFSRALIKLNIEHLLSNFFNILDQEFQEIEKQMQEIDFLTELLILALMEKRKKRAQRGPKFFVSAFSLRRTEFENPIPTFSLNFKNTLSKTKTCFLLQKLFFEYKNLTLNYLQILQLENFC